jgi:hypothetical protein
MVMSRESKTHSSDTYFQNITGDRGGPVKRSALNLQTELFSSSYLLGLTGLSLDAPNVNLPRTGFRMGD